MAFAVVASSDSGSERPMSEKQAGAFRTISEAAEELGIPPHVLRFWESRFAQVKPLKRGGGRRYYRPEDLDLLKGIRRLLHGQGYTIRGAQRVLKENGVRFVQAVGRGEAEASMPVLDEREAASLSAASIPDHDDDEARLRDVLEELRACRDAIARLHP